MDFLETVLLVLVTTILRRYYFLYLIWSLIFCLCGIWNDSFIFDNTIFTIPLTYYRPFQADSSVAVYSNCQCFGHLLWKSCPLGFPLVLLLFVAVLIDLIPKTRRCRNQHSVVFQTPIANTDVYKGSFFPQTIRDWNALPDSLISSAEDAEDCVAKFTSLVRARD